MDLNFLIFPKPEFIGPSDVFYSKLLLIPNKRARLKSISSKKSGINKDYPPPTDSPGLRVVADMEGTPMVPRVIVKKSFDFLKSKPQITQPIRSLNEAINSSTTGDNEIQEVRALDKSVRLPKSPILKKELNLVPKPSENSPQQKRITFNSGLQSVRPPKAKGNSSNVTLSKLMNDLESFKQKKPSGINLKSHIDSKYISRKLRKPEETKIVIEKANDFDEEAFNEDFCAPNELCPKEELYNGGAKSLFQKRSLNQLNNMFPKHSAERLNSEPQAPYFHINSKATAKSPGPKLMVRTTPPNRQEENSTNFDMLDENINNQSAQTKMQPYNRSSFTLNLRGKLASKYKESLRSSVPSQLDTKGQQQIDANRMKNLIHAGLNEYDSIPCLLTTPEGGSDILLLYFHANGEDIHQIQNFCELLKASFKVGVPTNAVLGPCHGVSRL